MNSDLVVQATNVSKKFCRRLKSALWYGVQDVAADVCGLRGGGPARLRPHEFWSVRNVSLQVRKGECVGLIGANGAGKSTFLKLVSGILKPDAGQISIRGRVGGLIELGAGFHPILTGRENIYINAAVLGLAKQAVDRRLDEILEFADIGESIDSPVQTYSSGMRVRLGFSIAAFLQPDLFLIDEVLAVGDVAFSMKCYKHILSLIDGGTSIILVTHNLNQLSRVSKRVVVFSDGQTVHDGALESGIALYEELSLNERNESKLAGDATNRAPARLSARTLDAAGHPRREFATGDDVVVEIKIRTDEAIPKARLIVAVESTAGVLASLSTFQGPFHFDVASPGTILRLRLMRVPLLLGSYHFNVSLYGPKVDDFYERQINVTSFQITSPPTNALGFGPAGIIQLSHEWQQHDVVSPACVCP